MFFWLTAFIIGLNEMTVSGSFGSWYWTKYSNIDKHLKDKLPAFAVIGSFLRSVFYHAGTIAFGSFLIAICKLLRVILEFISNRLKDKNGNENKLVKCVLCCCKCCMCCLENFLKYINRHAFIITSIYSLNFIRAASKAFKLVTTNIVRVSVVDRISYFLLFLSNLSITAICGVASFYFFTKKIPFNALQSYTPDLNYYFLPMSAIIVGVFFIGKLFFDVFSMGIDTLLICVLIDVDKNDGSKSRPYFMSKELRKILKVGYSR